MSRGHEAIIDLTFVQLGNKREVDEPRSRSYY